MKNKSSEKIIIRYDFDRNILLLKKWRAAKTIFSVQNNFGEILRLLNCIKNLLAIYISKQMLKRLIRYLAILPLPFLNIVIVCFQGFRVFSNAYHYSGVILQNYIVGIKTFNAVHVDDKTLVYSYKTERPQFIFHVRNFADRLVGLIRCMYCYMPIISLDISDVADVYCVTLVLPF